MSNKKVLYELHILSLSPKTYGDILFLLIFASIACAIWRFVRSQIDAKKISEAYWQKDRETDVAIRDFIDWKNSHPGFYRNKKMYRTMIRLETEADELRRTYDALAA